MTKYNPEDEDDLTVTELQRRQPWVVPYSDHFNSASYHTPHNRATHAILHAMKSLGKIATVLEAIDHRGGAILDREREVIQEMSADIFTIALRLANLFSFSLVHSLRRRVKIKNDIDILSAPVAISDRADMA